MLIGLRKASGRYVLLMDDDTETVMEKLPEFWDRILDGCDVVSGLRQCRDEISAIRRSATKSINGLMGCFAGQRFGDGTSPIKMF